MNPTYPARRARVARIAEEIIELLVRRGDAEYGEDVTIRDHMLQTALRAEAAGAAPALVLAALLHDVGHLIEDVPADLASWTRDAHHEEVGARWLARYFSAEVIEPVRLHVPAKRYLCAIDERYGAQLSEASVHTLKLQGGPMSGVEARRFEQLPFHEAAVRLRRWDDEGKVPHGTTRELESYRGLIESLAAGAA